MESHEFIPPSDKSHLFCELKIYLPGQAKIRAERKFLMDNSFFLIVLNETQLYKIVKIDGECQTHIIYISFCILIH